MLIQEISLQTVSIKYILPHADHYIQEPKVGNYRNSIIKIMKTSHICSTSIQGYPVLKKPLLIETEAHAKPDATVKHCVSFSTPDSNPIYGGRPWTTTTDM